MGAPDMNTAARCLRVLVVDDEPLIRWSIAETLGAAGHQVTEAQDAASALKALADASGPDVVLLDFRLPDSNDLDLLARIRQIAPAASVIMMTAFGTPDVTAGALKLGASRVLNKPFNMRDLEDIVRSL
jgi:DNA-binding NtrC family response regulator